MQLGAQDWGPWFWQPFMLGAGGGGWDNGTFGLAHPDLDSAQSSPTSLFPGEAPYLLAHATCCLGQEQRLLSFFPSRKILWMTVFPPDS